MNSDQSERRPPGFLWIIILAVTWFCAGFFGPLVFVPEANQGPLVGILISGPAGVVLGLMLWLLFRFLPVSGRTQWRLLVMVAVVGTVATLLKVQPQPATRGYVVELEIRGQQPPAATTEKVVDYWHKRIAAVTWSAPRSGWEQQMRTTLAADRGLVVDAVLVRQRTVKVHRKPWNRGRLFVTDWETKDETRSYYFPADALPASPLTPGTKIRYFLAHDSTARIEAPDTWPPAELISFITVSRLHPIPAEYERL